MANIPSLSSIEADVKKDIVVTKNFLQTHPKFTLLLIGFLFGLVLGLIL
jgi:hypothetical protein